MSVPREVIGEALSRYLTADQVERLIDEVLAIEKRVSAEFMCKQCGKRQMQWVRVPDAKAVALALPDLMNQAWGRPSETSEHVDPIIFKRLTKLDDE